MKTQSTGISMKEVAFRIDDWFMRGCLLRKGQFLVITIILCLVSTICKSQFVKEQQGYEHYSTSAGLSENTVYDLLEDSHGVLWAGTQAALDRFDGLHFFRYSEFTVRGKRGQYIGFIKHVVENVDSSGVWFAADTVVGYISTSSNLRKPICIATPKVLALLPVHGNRVLISTVEGVFSVSADFNSIFPVLASSSDDEVLKLVQVLSRDVQDSSQKILALSNRGRLLHLDYDGRSVLLSVATSSTIPNAAVDLEKSWCYLTGGTLFLSIDGESAYCQSGDNLTSVFGSHWEHITIASKAVVDTIRHVDEVVELANGVVLLASRKSGLFSFANGHFERCISGGKISVSDIGTPRSLSKGSHGGFWLGTDGAGLFHYSLDNPSIVEMCSTSLDDNFGQGIWSFEKTIGSEGLLVATYGAGIVELDSIGTMVGRYQIDDSTALENEVRVIRAFGTDYFIGTSKGLYRCSAKSITDWYLSPPLIRSALIRGVAIHPVSGSVVVCTKDSGVYVARRGGKFRLLPIPAFVKDCYALAWKENGRELLIGTNRGLLEYAVDESGELHYQDAHFMDVSVVSIATTGDTAWLGTLYDGLWSCFWRDGNSADISKINGEIDNEVVYTVVQAAEGNSLWLSTNHGLYEFSIKQGWFNHYGPEHGVMSLEFNHGAWHILDSNHLIFGGTGGATVVQTNKGSIQSLPGALISLGSDDKRDVQELLIQNSRSSEFAPVSETAAYCVLKVNVVGGRDALNSRYRIKLNDEGWSPEYLSGEQVVIARERLHTILGENLVKVQFRRGDDLDYSEIDLEINLPPNLIAEMKSNPIVGWLISIGVAMFCIVVYILWRRLTRKVLQLNQLTENQKHQNEYLDKIKNASAALASAMEVETVTQRAIEHLETVFNFSSSLIASTGRLECDWRIESASVELSGLSNSAYEWRAINLELGREVPQTFDVTEACSLGSRLIQEFDVAENEVWVYLPLLSPKGSEYRFYSTPTERDGEAEQLLVGFVLFSIRDVAGVKRLHEPDLQLYLQTLAAVLYKLTLKRIEGQALDALETAYRTALGDNSKRAFLDNLVSWMNAMEMGELIFAAEFRYDVLGLNQESLSAVCGSSKDARNHLESLKEHSRSDFRKVWQAAVRSLRPVQRRVGYRDVEDRPANANVLAAPISLEERVQGGLFLVGPEEFPWKHRVVVDVLIQGIGERASELKLYRSLESLMPAFDVLTEPVEHLRPVIHAIRDYFDCSYVSVWLRDYSAGNEQYRQRLASKELQDICDTWGVEPTDYSALSVAPLVFIPTGRESESGNRFNEFCLRNDFKGYVQVPLQTEHAIYGFIQIYVKRGKVDLHNDDRKFLELVVSKACDSLATSTVLFNTLETYAAIRTEPLNSILKRVVNVARVAIGSDPVILFPFDSEKQLVEYKEVAYSGEIRGDWYARITRTTELSFVDDIIRNGGQVFDYRNPPSPRYNHPERTGSVSFWEEQGIRAMVARRLEYQGIVVGVMFFNYRSDQNFGSDDSRLLRLIGAFANLATDAILSARYVSIIDQRQRELDELSKKVQEENVVLINKAEEILPAARRTSLVEIVRQVNHSIINTLMPMQLMVGQILKDPDRYLRRVSDRGAFERHLRNLRLNIDSVTVLVKLFRPRSFQESVEDLNKLVTEVVRLFVDRNKSGFSIGGDLVKPTIEFDLSDLKKDIPDFRCSKAEIAMLLHNLLSNAERAVRYRMEDDGKAQSSNVRPGLIRLRTDYESETKTFIISISDNGIGFGNETKRKMFDDGYTERRKEDDFEDVQRVHGIGLFFVKSTIEAHYMGEVIPEGRIGEGATFTLRMRELKP